MTDKLHDEIARAFTDSRQRKALERICGHIGNLTARGNRSDRRITALESGQGTLVPEPDETHEAPEPTTATLKSYKATLSLLLFVDATMPTWRRATMLEVEPAEVRQLIEGKGGNNFGSDAFRKARADAPGWYRVTFEAHVGPKMLKMIGTPTIAPDVDAWRANMTG